MLERRHQVCEAVDRPIRGGQQVGAGSLQPGGHHVAVGIDKTRHHRFTGQINLFGGVAHQWFGTPQVTHIDNLAVPGGDSRSPGIVVVNRDDFAVHEYLVGGFRCLRAWRYRGSIRCPTAHQHDQQCPEKKLWRLNDVHALSLQMHLVSAPLSGGRPLQKSR